MSLFIRRRRSRRGALAGALLAAALTAPGASALAADRLPDLRMAHPADLKVDTSTISGHRLLRYTSVIVNVGRGPFEVHGDRTSTSAPMAVTQRIFNDAGGYRDVATAATMFFAGDGHNHWHLRDLETGELIRPDNGSKVGTLAKHGFCFFDNVAFQLSLTGAPQSPFYTGCGSSTSLHIVPGLSIGWGDKYAATLAYQYIDVTGLANGRYRLQVGVNTGLGFQEADSTNDGSWIEIRLGAHSAKITAYGPGA